MGFSGHTNKAAEYPFDPEKKFSEKQIRDFSKLHLATLQASDNEKEAMLWQAVNSKNYTTVSLLLEWYPHLINSCQIDTGKNLLISLFLFTKHTPPLDLVKQLVETDKAFNKTKSSQIINAINARSDTFIYIYQGYDISFDRINGRNDGLSTMDMLLYRLTDLSFLYTESAKAKNKKVALQKTVKYLISEGGFFNTETYWQRDFRCMWLMRYKTGINPTLGTIIDIILKTRPYNIDALELFLQGSKININTHVITGGMNVLHWAASKRYQAIIECLLKIPELDINYLSTEGKTALDYLYLSGNITDQSLKLLQGKNAKTAQQLKAGTHNHNIQHGVPDNQQVIEVQQPNLLPGVPAPGPVPGNNPQVIQHQWYKKPSTYCIAGIVTCSALVYGAYRYFYPGFDDAKEIDEDEQETTQDDTCQKNDVNVT